MNIAVIYKSMSGHSRKIAKAIAEALGLKSQNIKKKPVLQGVDLLFIVGGIYGGKSLSNMTEYIKTINSRTAKKAVLITSSASNKSGQDEVREILISNGVVVHQEEYRCLGNFLFIKMWHPNKSEIAGAVDFAKNIVEIK